MKQRLDTALVKRGLLDTRSQAESEIRLGHVAVNRKIITKPGAIVGADDRIELTKAERYVSRAAYKLESITKRFKIDFENKVVLDVGSSTGGFTDFALQHGAKKVIAIDVGTNQLHEKLRADARIELHEKTDIRDVRELSTKPDIVVADLSFISLRKVLERIRSLVGSKAIVVAMAKPQFEAGPGTKHKGVIKNERVRRDILKLFEAWASEQFIIKGKADSEVTGAKGNRERFYLLVPKAKR